jgi:Tol biopolymer transport system component
MGNVKKVDEVKLVITVFSSQKELIKKVKGVLIKKFGPLDYESYDLKLVTDYYKQELGPDLIRQFYAFKRLIKRDKIAEIKLYTNKLEDRFKANGKRRINIDPGYLSLGKFILTTSKNQQQRIYLKKGIFAECALRYVGKSFTTWPWTYPDYATEEYCKVLNEIREVYFRQIR